MFVHHFLPPKTIEVDVFKYRQEKIKEKKIEKSYTEQNDLTR